MQDVTEKLSPFKVAYNVPEAAKAIGLGRSTLFELIRDGKLKAVKAAGRRLILRTDIDAYLESCRET